MYLPLETMAVKRKCNAGSDNDVASLLSRSRGEFRVSHVVSAFQGHFFPGSGEEDKGDRGKDSLLDPLTHRHFFGQNGEVATSA